MISCLNARCSAEMFTGATYAGVAEPPAGILNDMSKWHHDGIFTVGPTWVQLPSGMWVMDFDGDNDGVNLGNFPEQYLNTKDGLTLMVWAYGREPTAGANTKLAHRDKQIQLLWSNPTDTLRGGVIRLYDNNPGVMTWKDTGVANDVDTDTWYFITATYDGVDTLTNYVNGEVSSSASVGMLWLSGGTETGGAIGCKSDLTNHFFNGMMSSFRYYRRLMPPERIQATYMAERHWFGL